MKVDPDTGQMAVIMFDMNQAIFIDAANGIILMTIAGDCRDCEKADYCEDVKYVGLPLVTL